MTTANGSSALRMLSSAAIGTSITPAQFCEFVDGGAGLLEVLQRAVGGQGYLLTPVSAYLQRSMREP